MNLARFGKLARARLAQSAPAKVSRRQFVRSAAGAAAAGAALGIGLRPVSLLAAHADPKPIPGGTPLLGGAFHVYAPGPAAFGLDGLDAEPSTITDFNGDVGIAFISGMVTRTHVPTGTRVDLPYLFNDMRFMDGEYRGEDGHVRKGTFALV